MSVATGPTPPATEPQNPPDELTTADGKSLNLLTSRSVFNDSEDSGDPLVESPWLEKVLITLIVLVPLAGCVFGGFQLWQNGMMSWLDVGLLAGGWYATGLGITVGFHRMLAHRAFDARGVVRYFWMALGSLAIQGSPLMWCAVHRRHHQCSDKPGDPHSPHLHNGGVWHVIRGFLHAHTGWLYSPYWSDPRLKKFIPDLLEDKQMLAIDRFYYLWIATSLATDRWWALGP